MKYFFTSILLLSTAYVSNIQAQTCVTLTDDSKVKVLRFTNMEEEHRTYLEILDIEPNDVAEIKKNRKSCVTYDDFYKSYVIITNWPLDKKKQTIAKKNFIYDHSLYYDNVQLSSYITILSADGKIYESRTRNHPYDYRIKDILEHSNFSFRWVKLIQNNAIFSNFNDDDEYFPSKDLFYIIENNKLTATELSNKDLVKKYLAALPPSNYEDAKKYIFKTHSLLDKEKILKERAKYYEDKDKWWFRMFLKIDKAVPNYYVPGAWDNF